jgi:hypothetical protein
VNARRLVTAALLLFVAATLGKLGLDAARAGGAEAAADAPADGVAAFYFHTNKRCTTCRNMEAWTAEALRAAFPADRVAWRTVNFEEPEHAHYADEFELITSSVVLVRYADGARGDWQVLDEAWDLVGDRAEFQAYVTRSARAFVEGRP